MQKLERQLRIDLEQVEAELNVAEARAGQLRWQRDYIRKLLGLESDNPALAMPEIVEIPRLDLSTTEMVEQILREEGKAMAIKEIGKMAVLKGYTDPVMPLNKIVANISSAIAKAKRSPRKRFVKISRGVFDLAERHP